MKRSQNSYNYEMKICRPASQKGERSKVRARAQMRSIDFALSFTIFVILLVYLFLAASGTTNTIYYKTEQRTEEMTAYNTASHIIEITGTPHAWDHNIKEFPEIFGLASVEMQETSSEFAVTALDAGKIARIDPTLENVELKNWYPYLYVPYPVARNRIATTDKNYHFSIEIVGIIEVGLHITLHEADLEIESIVRSQNNPQEGAIVWTYIIDPGGGLLGYSESITNANGVTSVIEAGLPRPGAYVIVTIAEKRLGYAYDYSIINYKTERELEVITFAQPYTRPGTGLILQCLTINPEVASTHYHTYTVRDANATVLFVGGDTETIQLEGNEALQVGKTTLRAHKPQIIVTRAQVLLNQTLVYGVGITAIPLILDDSHHPEYPLIDHERDPAPLVESMYVMKRLVTVHGIPMFVIVKLWK